MMSKGTADGYESAKSESWTPVEADNALIGSLLSNFLSHRSLVLIFLLTNVSQEEWISVIAWTYKDDSICIEEKEKLGRAATPFEEWL